MSDPSAPAASAIAQPPATPAWDGSSSSREDLGWAARLRDVLGAAADPRLAPEYAVWAQPWMVRFLILVVLTYGGGVLLALWPLDYLTHAPFERARFAELRLANLAVCTVSIAGLASPWIRARVRLWSGATLVAVTAVGAWCASALPHDPYYWPGLLAPLSAMIILAPITERVLWTLLIGLAHNAAWHLGQPGALELDATPPSIGLYVMAIVIGITAGHMMTYFSYQLFLGRRELARYNERLERDVEKRTAQIRRLAERVQRIHEDERSRLAAELHDELGQTLTALRLETAMIERGTPPAEAAAALNGHLDELFESVRFIVGSLRPRALDAGLAAACDWLVERFRSRTGIATRADIEDVAGLGGGESLTVFRTLQECLTNVARHAEATTVTVSLARDAERGDLVLTIRDDGVGFDPEAGTEGHGLSAMRERALAIGATLTVSSRLPGTTVELRIGAGA